MVPIVNKAVSGFNVLGLHHSPLVGENLPSTFHKFIGFHILGLIFSMSIDHFFCCYTVCCQKLSNWRFPRFQQRTTHNITTSWKGSHIVAWNSEIKGSSWLDIFNIIQFLSGSARILSGYCNAIETRRRKRRIKTPKVNVGVDWKLKHQPIETLVIC